MVTMFGSYVILPRHLVKSQYYDSHTPIAQTPMARLRLVSRCSLLSHSHRRPETSERRKRTEHSSAEAEFLPTQAGD